MARPRKDLSINKEQKQISYDIINQLGYDSTLSQEQLESLKATIDSTLSQYSIEKDSDVEDDIRDTNMEVLEEFIAAKRVESKSETTLYNYNNEIAKFFLVTNKDYREITSSDVRRYMDYRKQHDNVKTVTIKNIRMYLMSFFRWCMIEEKIMKNPMDRIAPVKEEQHIIETLTDEESEIIRCACKCERDLAIIDLLSGSGMRVSELCGLNREDIDFESGEVKVFGKGSKERTCFLTGKAKVHLRWYLESRTDDNEALFVTQKRPYNRLTKNGVEYILKNIAASSRIPRTRLYPHKYRSTLATNMINKGASADKVQQILGHSSVDTTLKCYARVDKQTVKNAHHVYVS